MMIKPVSLRLGALVLLMVVLMSCASSARQSNGRPGPKSLSAQASQTPSQTSPIQNPGRVIHVVVALCDNQYQGIVPVPADIGNGDDPARNLYWGAGHGVKNHFRKAKDWMLLLEVENPKRAVLERVVFKHRARDVYMVADAYQGREIRRSTIDFLRFSSGRDVEEVALKDGARELKLAAGGGADMVAYVGHDGLMDFSLPEYPQKADERTRDAVILSCASKPYFSKPLRATGAHPLLWTTNLMAPEAYVLKAAVEGWMNNETGEAVRKRAAESYNRYQKCGIRGAMNLFATGW